MDRASRVATTCATFVVLVMLAPRADAAAVCGDAVTERPSETCDPPGTLLANGARCRADCTFCGDGIVQESGGESCDDADEVSGCRSDRPEKPLDRCLATCQRPLCGDPSRIRLVAGAVGRDVVDVHARLVSDLPYELDRLPFEVEIARRICADDPARPCHVDADCDGGALCTDRGCDHDPHVPCDDDATCAALQAGATCAATRPEAVVLRATLPDGIPMGNPPRWRYRNRHAKDEGGIYGVKAQAQMIARRCAGGPADDRPCDVNYRCPGAGDCVGFYVLWLRAYAPATLAAADMETRVRIGAARWAARGLWKASKHGWRFDKHSPRLSLAR